VIILRDTREQRGYTFDRYDCQVETATLSTGDYSLPAFMDGGIAVERKNGIDELAMCLSSERTRFERELMRAMAFERFYVVIEGRFEDIMAGRYRSKMAPKSVIASIAAFTNRYGIPFLFCGERSAAEMMTYQLLTKYLYEIDQRYQQATKAQEGKATG